MNVLTKRQSVLLGILAWETDFVTVQELANQLHKSIRTVYGELAVIEDWLQREFCEVQIEKKRSIGVRLVGNTERLRANEDLKREDLQTVEFSPEIRQQQIATDLLIHNACITYQGLMNKYFVSSTSIKNDLEKIKVNFNTKLNSGKKGTSVADTEEALRQSIFLLVEQVLETNGIRQINLLEETGAAILSQLFGEQLTNYGMGKVFELYYGDAFSLSEQYVISLTIHLLTYLKRLTQGFTLEGERTFLFQQINSMDTYYLAHSIVEEGAADFGYTFCTADIEALNHLLLSQGVQMKTTDHFQNQQVCQSVRSLIKSMSEIFEVDLTDDAVLEKHLVCHFPPMIYRLKSGLKIVNPLLTEIKEQYVLTFNSVWYGLGGLEETLGVTFNDDEVSFIAVYFQVALEKLDFGKKILIVCPTGIGTSELILSKVRKVLPQKDILEVTTMKQLEKNDISKVDFIISSVELPAVAVPVVRVTPLVNQNDLRKIHVLYSELFLEDTFFRDEGSKEGRTTEIFKRENFYASQTLTTKAAVLDYLIQKLELRAAVLPDFRGDILQREKLGATALETGVAIPHAAPRHVLKTQIMVLALDKAIDWDQQKIDLVILICIAEPDRRKVRPILAEIYKIVATREKVRQFKKQVEEERNKDDVD